MEILNALICAVYGRTPDGRFSFKHREKSEIGIPGSLASASLRDPNREHIGIIGICGWGGMALNAVAVDKGVKAVVASTMYDMTRVMSKGYNDSVTLEQRTQTLEQLSRQRWQDAEKRTPAYQSPTTTCMAARRGS